MFSIRWLSGNWQNKAWQLEFHLNHTTLVVWIHPKSGGRFVLLGDGTFCGTWIPRGLRQLEPTCGQFRPLVCWYAVAGESYDGYQSVFCCRQVR
jgi:hypothetical protein